MPLRNRPYPLHALFALSCFVVLSGASLAVLPAAPAHAQRAARVRPAFEPKLVRRMTVAGTVRLRVVARRDGLPHEFAPIGSGGWVAVVRIDGHPVASLKRLPGIVEWDTRAAGDGVHEVSVGVRNAAADQEVGVEGAQVVVDNAAADTAAEAAELARGGDKGSADQAPRLVLTPPDAANVSQLAPRLSRSANPLAARATALLPAGPRLYLGLPEGGVAWCAPGTPKDGGTVVRLPAPDAVGAGPVRSLAAGGGRVWWVTASGRSVYAYGLAARSLTRYDVTGTLAPPPAPPVVPVEEPKPDAPAVPEMPTTEQGAEAPPAPAAEPPATEPAVEKPIVTPPAEPARPTGWVRRVALLRGRVLLLGDEGAARVLDPRTGALTAPTADSFPGLLPAEALASSGDGGPAPRLYVAASPATAEGKPGPALVVALTPAPRPDGANGAPSDGRWRRWRLRAWRSGADGSWRPAADFATDADPDRAASSCVAAAPDALATAEREGPRCCAPGAAAPCDLPFALSPGMPSSTDKVAVGPGGGRVWWEQRGIVFGADPRTGARECYLPWNVPGGTGAVLALAADENGAWVATMSAGVRRIRPGRPNAGDGYDGYVRARLGAGTLVPPSARAARVAAAIDAWQGTRYVWGGQSRSGTDCSGFLMRMHQVGGVSIPRTTAEMRRSSAGRRVRDELRWGDTLVYPGHCAMYVGDGRTAETVGGSRDGSVSHSSVWVRGNVVVRRFLP